MHREVVLAQKSVGIFGSVKKKHDEDTGNTLQQGFRGDVFAAVMMGGQTFFSSNQAVRDDVTGSGF
jgi:hypothetical protein